MGFLGGLLSTFVANIAFWFLLGALFWLANAVVARRFSRFFGLNRIGSVTIYLSNLWKPTSGFSQPEGYTISLHELRAAQSIDKLFGAAPMRLPDLVRGLVDTVWLRRPVMCTTQVCPPEFGRANLDENLIVVGSSARNSVRAHFVQAKVPSAILADEDVDPRNSNKATRITISRDGNNQEISMTKTQLTILEKCRDPERGTTVFFCMGTRADGSWAAAEYLVRNWKKLAREFRDKDFVICLGFPYSQKYMDEYKEPLRLSVRN